MAHLGEQLTFGFHTISAFLIRLSGFSFRRLEGLRFPRTLEMIDAAERTETHLSQAASSLLGVIDEVRYDAHPAFRDDGTYNARRRRVHKLRAFAKAPSAALPADLFAEIGALIPESAAALDELARAHRERCERARELESAFAIELDAQRSVLRGLFADGRLREAVFLESPNALVGIDAMRRDEGPRSSRAKLRERTATMYLQRFCAKNDTNSMCGPFGIGFFSTAEGETSFAIGDELRARRTYFSFWAAERLIHAFAGRAGVERTLKIRRNPTARIDGEEREAISWCTITHDATTFFKRTYRRARAGEELLVLFSLLETPRTMSELTETLESKLGVPPEDGSAFVEQMLEAGLFTTSPSLPVGVFDPIRTARSEIERWPESQAKAEANDATAKIDRLVSEFGRADFLGRISVSAQLDEAFERLSGAKSRRGGGRHYADRSLLHEDCYSRVRADIGREQTAKLESALALLISAAALPLELSRENVRHWFRGRFGEGRAVPALEVHRAFDEDRPYAIDAPTEVASRLRTHIERVRSLFSSAVAGAVDRRARIDPAQLAEAVEGAPGSDRPGYASADLMLARRGSESPLWVIGEIHGFYMLPTFWFDVATETERDASLEEMRSTLERLAGGRETAEPLFLHTQATDRRFPIATTDLNMIGTSERSGVLDFGALDMVLNCDRFRFVAPRGEIVPVMTYSTYPFFSYTSSVAPLLDEFADKFLPRSLLPGAIADADAPRMMLGDVVFRRATWVHKTEMVAEALAAETEVSLFARAQRFRRKLGMPSCVFVSIPGEPKPVLVDFDDFFLVESFAHLVKSAPKDGHMKLSEMLPGPDELFVQGDDGPRTFELRLGVYRGLGT